MADMLDRYLRYLKANEWPRIGMREWYKSKRMVGLPRIKKR